MKLRVQLVEKGSVVGSGRTPPSHSLVLGPTGQEDGRFVPVGPTPGRRAPAVRLTLERLTAEVAGEFELGGEYLLTLEPVVRR